MTQLPNDNTSDADHKARQVEILISTLLRAGVMVSLLVVIAGMIVTFVHHPEYIHSKQGHVAPDNAIARRVSTRSAK